VISIAEIIPDQEGGMDDAPSGVLTEILIFED
jgi:hypothetical protein